MKGPEYKKPFIRFKSTAPYGFDESRMLGFFEFGYGLYATFIGKHRPVLKLRMEDMISFHGDVVHSFAGYTTDEGTIYAWTHLIEVGRRQIEQKI